MHAEEEQQFSGESQTKARRWCISARQKRLGEVSIMHHSTQAVTTCVLGKRRTAIPDRLSNHKRARAAQLARCDAQKPRTQTTASKSDTKEGAYSSASLPVPFAVDQ